VQPSAEALPTKRLSLEPIIKSFAQRLRRDFAAEIACDPASFKRTVIGLVRKELPPWAGRPRDDLVTALVHAEEAGDTLSEDELLAMVFLLLIAGYETNVDLIATGTLALLQNPQQRDRLQQNPALAESAVEVLLRYTSPLEMASVRLTREKVTIGAVALPRGELVLAVLGSANHDQSQFPDADTLDITREPNTNTWLLAKACISAWARTWRVWKGRSP